MQCVGAAKQAEEQKKKNCEIIRNPYTSWLRIVFHTQPRKELINEVLNGDKLLEKHLSEGLSNAQYTSRLSPSVLIEVINIWIKNKLTFSKRVPAFPSKQMSSRTSVLRKSYPSVAECLLMKNKKSTS